MYREKISRAIFTRQVVRRLVLRALLRSDSLTLLQKARVAANLDRLVTASSVSRHVTRCLNSGRTRFVLRRLGLSRMAFRRYLYVGKLPGVIKATW